MRVLLLIQCFNIYVYIFYCVANFSWDTICREMLKFAVNPILFLALMNFLLVSIAKQHLKREMTAVKGCVGGNPENKK